MVGNTSNMDMNINTSRKRSASSINSSRALSMHLNISSIPYHEGMEIQSNKLFWDEQVEINVRESFSLLYATLKIDKDILTYKVTDHNPKKGV